MGIILWIVVYVWWVKERLLSLWRLLWSKVIICWICDFRVLEYVSLWRVLYVKEGDVCVNKGLRELMIIVIDFVFGDSFFLM